MPRCGFLSLMPALLPVGDEFWINFEGLGVVYSTFLLFPSTCFRVGSELRREEATPVSGSLRSRIGRRYTLGLRGSFHTSNALLVPFDNSMEGNGGWPQ
jgi:hypothetical protein